MLGQTMAACSHALLHASFFRSSLPTPMPLSSSTQLHFALSLVRNQTVSMAATYKRLKQEQQELANLESGTSGATVETKKNKQRVLVLASRGITQRYRHLMEDVLTLLPHSVKESKFDQVMFGG